MGKRRVFFQLVAIALLVSTGCDRLSGPTLEEQERFEELKEQSEKELMAVRPFLEEEVLPELDSSGDMPSHAQIKALAETMKEYIRPAVDTGQRVRKFARETGQVEPNRRVLEKYHSVGEDLSFAVELLGTYDLFESREHKNDVLRAVRPYVEDSVEAISQL